MPELLTKAKVRTDAEGKYRLERLALGDYRLVVVHDDYCEGASSPQVGEEKAITVPPIKLQSGCLLEGSVTLDGILAAGIRVSVASATEFAAGKAVPIAGLQGTCRQMEAARTVNEA